MNITIKPDLKFKYKKTLEKILKQQSLNVDERILNANYELITLDQFLRKIFEKFSIINNKYQELINSNYNFDAIKYDYKNIINKIYFFDNRLDNPEYLFYWSDIHDQLILKFIDFFEKNEYIKNIFNELVFDSIFKADGISNFKKIFKITLLYLILMDPKLLIFAPSFIATKSTLKILTFDKEIFTPISAESLQKPYFSNNILNKFEILNNFMINQDYFLLLLANYFHIFYEKVFINLKNDENIQNLTISLYDPEFNNFDYNIEILLRTRFHDNIISKIYMERKIRYLDVNLNLPISYSLGKYYIFTFQFYINDNLIKLKLDDINRLILTISKIERNQCDKKIRKILDMLGLPKNNYYYDSWRKKCVSPFLLFKPDISNKKIIEKYSIINSFIKKFFRIKVKKINYKLKKI